MVVQDSNSQSSNYSATGTESKVYQMLVVGKCYFCPVVMEVYVTFGLLGEFGWYPIFMARFGVDLV